MTREVEAPLVQDRRKLVHGPMLDVLLLWADQRGIRRLRPAGGAELRLEGAGTDHPTRSVRRTVEALGLRPRFVHSTSWRFEDGQVVLTYVAVVDPPNRTPAGARDEAVVPAELARCEPLEPPSSITSEQVLEHTIRHLAWLVREDAGARTALADWAPFLRGHHPEPFMAFEPTEQPGMPSIEPA